MHIGNGPMVACVIVGALSIAGCAIEPGNSDIDTDQSDNETPEINEIAQAFSGNWLYSWGVTQSSGLDIGTSTNRTCFLTGITGNIQPASLSEGIGCSTATAVRVLTDASGEYSLYIQPSGCGKPLQGFARCVNSATGRTSEVTWMTGQAAKLLGTVTARRRCFLTGVTTSTIFIDNQGVSHSGSGFNTTSDSVQIWNDGTNWYLGGSQSGAVWANARCIDVNVDNGGWVWQAGNPGSRKDPLTNAGGATCFLTGIGGGFFRNDWNDGVYISNDPGLNQFYMNTTNGKTGWARCVQ